MQVGLVGTGFIARGIQSVLALHPKYQLCSVLTRRPLDSVKEFPSDLLTNDINQLMNSCEVVIECTGDPLYATVVLEALQKAGFPLLTMNPELHITTGSYFARKGYISDCKGDQPGCLADLKEEVETMGFSPLAYLNIKRFLNHNPTREDMDMWARRWGVSVSQVTSFTDGTKLQVEQVLIANGLDCAIAKEGLIGKAIDDVKDTELFGDVAKELGMPIADYFLCANAPPGVLLVADCPYPRELHQDWGPMKYISTRNEKYCYFLKNYHLCHLEIVKNLRRIESGLPPLINNSKNPKYSVAAVAKCGLRKGERIQSAIGSFEVRGVAIPIKDYPKHVPIGLMHNAVLTRDIEVGEKIEFSDVDLPPSRALEIYLDMTNPQPEKIH